MIDIGGYEIELRCLRCGFYNPIYIKQARLRDVIICRGCKTNIQLDDHMNQVRKAEREIRKQSDQLTASFESLNMTLTI